MVTKICGQENVRSGKCPFGEVSFGELSVRGIVRSGKCPSRMCPRRSVSRGTVQSGNCPHTGNFTLSLPLCYLLDLETIGCEKRRFLHIWLLQRIVLYQKRQKIRSLGTIKFLDTHVYINNPHWQSS